METTGAIDGILTHAWQVSTACESGAYLGGINDLNCGGLLHVSK